MLNNGSVIPSDTAFNISSDHADEPAGCNVDRNLADGGNAAEGLAED
jgi:hypothetical protein